MKFPSYTFRSPGLAMFVDILCILVALGALAVWLAEYCSAGL